VAALALPSVAVAGAGLHLDARFGSVTAAPVSASAIPAGGYHSGTGELIVDLRTAQLPATGVVRLPIHAGVRRTIVALPTNRCVHVDVRYHVHPFLGRFARDVLQNGFYPGVVVFGQSRYAGEGRQSTLDAPQAGPTLQVDFESAGGGLYVRDYPSRMNPRFQPEWPGLPVYPEPRPHPTGVTKKEAKRELRAWKRRVRIQRRDRRRVQRLMPGPCGKETSR
jgi:hypothetical protein